jgi:hypothetical protein
MLTGVVIAAIIKQPLIALPAAFVSHFVFDAVPHFGFQDFRGFIPKIKYRVTQFSLVFDFFAWVAALYFASHLGWLALACGFLATSPDLSWVYWYFRYERKKQMPKENWFTRFHKWIQWGERPWGIVIEVAYFVLLSVFVAKEYL